ncbi:BQ2448_1961 [Microbotryum intermedium]|uniref:BQ2448_1961 protein n=1 Tax=Microbotryum intermedium TaxID=269621 RepID=A0A238F9Y0_9BASI|nr:BQ2448_1961 [Microbotryum intermedium]
MKEELFCLQDYSPALHEWVMAPHSGLDELVEGLDFRGTLGKEEPMKDLSAQINALMVHQGPAVRRIVSSGFLSAIVPSSEGQVANDAQDTVALFCFASTDEIERVWGMSDEEWKREAERLGHPPEDNRRTDQVLAAGELKGGNQGGSAGWQTIQRFYRVKSSIAIREYTYGFTLAESRFKVLVHMPGGIIKTNDIDCSKPEGFRALARFLVRLVVCPEQDLGSIASGGAFPLTINSLPAIIYQRPNTPSFTTRHGARVWEPLYRDDAMTGATHNILPRGVRQRRDPQLPFIHGCSKADSWFLVGLAMVDVICRDDARLLTAPPDVRGGVAACPKGWIIARAAQFTGYGGFHKSILEVQSTLQMTQVILDAVKGVRSLHRLQLLHRDLSYGKVRIKADDTGCLMISDWIGFLNDPLTGHELLEAVGTLTTMARAMLPTRKSRTSHQLWHEVEQFVYVIQYVVSNLPSGPHRPARMSKDDQEMWTKWDLGDPRLHGLKSTTDIDRLFALMFKYCGLGLVREDMTISEEETVLAAKWGSRDGAALLLDRLIDDMEKLLNMLALQRTEQE